MGGLAIFFSIILFTVFLFYCLKQYVTKKNAGENYLSDENYQKVSKNKKLSGFLCIFLFFIGVIVSKNSVSNVPQLNENEQFISKLSGEYKELYDNKFNEYISEGKEEYQAKILAVKAVKDKKMEEQQFADEQERLAQAEEEKILAEKKAEEERLATEKKAEEERLAAEKKAEEEKLAAAKKAEEERLAAEKKVEQEKLVAAKKAEEEKIVAEKNSESNSNSVIGLFSKIKSGLEDIAEVEFGELTNEEIFVGNETNGFISYDFYILPETTRPLIDGIIFETREGYIIDVKTKKAGTDEVVGVVPFYFYNSNDFWAPEGRVKYKITRNDSKKPITDEKIVLEIYNASKKFSILH